MNVTKKGKRKLRQFMRIAAKRKHFDMNAMNEHRIMWDEQRSKAKRSFTNLYGN